jgi:hypothetical protein
MTNWRIVVPLPLDVALEKVVLKGTYRTKSDFVRKAFGESWKL